MPLSLPLDEMTVPEKLEIMEALWGDLPRHADTFEVPEWHRTLLEERERRTASGAAKFTPWEQAKDDIRRRVS